MANHDGRKASVVRVRKGHESTKFSRSRVHPKAKAGRRILVRAQVARSDSNRFTTKTRDQWRR